jgi:rare lipoprotein A (peptidoglycan hydrolase)
MSRALRRAWLLSNVAITLALLPALLPDEPGARSETTVAAAGSDTYDVMSPVSTMLVPTTTTTAPPPPTTAAPAAKAAPRPTTTTTAAPRPTTTAAPRPAPTTPPAPAAAPAPPPSTGSETGRATWYDYRPGICAHKTLPFGTVVTVNAVNGKSVKCTVGDRGPFVDGYVIDLHWQEFEQLAPRSAGRIDVTITW